jgi:hypothetical protein
MALGEADGYRTFGFLKRFEGTTALRDGGCQPSEMT